MHIRTFKAASLQDALEEIRQQMGPDASVLHTRQVREGWMGWLGRTYVEVTAGLKDGQRDDSEAIADSLAEGRRLETAHPPADAPTLSFQDRNDTLSNADQEPQPSEPETSIGRIYMNAAAAITPSRIRERSEVNRIDGIFPAETQSLPGPLQAYREELLMLGVDHKTVDRWLRSTVSFASGLGEPFTNQIGSSVPWLEHLQRSVAREIRLGSPIRTQPGERSIVALVGPTGVGKTTTVAKLAAGFRLQAKRRVGLLTIDTFRIAAVQQLRAYAEIMDLPMEVVETPEQMRPALGRLGDVDLVLIDTAGRSPRSDARIEQLVDFLRSAQPDETHLVLSSTSSASALRTTIQGFAPVRPTAAILTKLDETPQTAGVLSALAASDDQSGLPLSYTTNGQQVPDDIDTAKHEYLLSRMLQPLDIGPLEAA